MGGGMAVIGGSSPHARGALAAGEPLVAVPGLIPARAGSTREGVAARAHRGAHPRTRGEHTGVYDVSATAWGSSPHARGAPHLIGWSLRWAGLIPARAGSTCRRWARGSFARAHPRTRGEHSGCGVCAGRPEGSSPHARGARDDRAQPVEGGGLIPARAGSTDVEDLDVVAGGAHPRTRGEHRPLPVWAKTSSGSSPHARGAPGVPRRRHRLRGLIPARAGSTPRAPA